MKVHVVSLHLIKNRGPRRTRAFTLLEVLITVSVLAALALMAWPLMATQLTASQLPESAAQMRSLLYMTRSSAMVANRRHRVRFAPGEQQPVVEVEADPIAQPGQYFPIRANWALEPVLLEGVEVNRIELGRPEFLKPISATENADVVTTEDELTKARAEAESATGEAVETVQNTEGEVLEEGIDPMRPPLIFEVDGSADWATIVLSKRGLDEPLTEEDDQRWVVLDGRTGLATVRDQVTQEQMADPAFYVMREKLEMPDAALPEDLTLTIPTDGGATDTSSSSFSLPATGMDANSDFFNNQGPATAGGQNQSQAPAEGGQQAAEQDPMAQLEQQLANSDLTEEEKEEIRRSFQQAQQDQQQK